MLANVATCCGFCLVLVGCGSGSSCKEVENLVLEDDASAPDGPSGLDVLELAASPMTLDLSWRDGVTNANGDAELVVAVERNAEPVRFVRTQQVGDLEDDAGCGSSLVVPVRLEVTTSDGALADTFATEIAYDTILGDITDDSVASFSVQFAVDELEGSLRPLDTRFAAGEVGGVFGAEVHGSVSFSAEGASDGNASEEFLVAGSW